MTPRLAPFLISSIFSIYMLNLGSGLLLVHLLYKYNNGIWRSTIQCSTQSPSISSLRLSTRLVGSHSICIKSRPQPVSCRRDRAQPPSLYIHTHWPQDRNQWTYFYATAILFCDILGNPSQLHHALIGSLRIARILTQNTKNVRHTTGNSLITHISCNPYSIITHGSSRG